MNGKFVQRHGVRSDFLLVTGGNQTKTETPYSDALESMLKLCQTVRFTPFCFRDVTFHRIPFLDARVLEILIQGMPNLENLSIASCLLLDATKLPRILKIILRNPRTKEKNEEIVGKSYIKVDFAPYRFFGPQTLDKQGSFLITYNKPDFDIPKAATALVYRCLPDAKEVGMDLLSNSSSFWHFFRQLPGPCPLWAVKVREAIVTQERYKDSPSLYAMALDNLCAAVSGDLRAPEYMPARRNDRNYGEYIKARLPYNYWRTEKECPICKATLSHCLFVNCAPDLPNGVKPRCWGCHLTGFVKNFDHSHFRYRKMTILHHLFVPPPPVPPPREENGTDSGADAGGTNTGGAGANPRTSSPGPVLAANGVGPVNPGPTGDARITRNPNTGISADKASRDDDGIIAGAGDANTSNEQNTRDYYDDDGIFDGALFSVKALSDPLGDEKARAESPEEFFSYRIFNFMAQNIGCARWLAHQTDMAWCYYKQLPHPVYKFNALWDSWDLIGEPLKHAPELDQGEHMTHAGIVYRWTRYYNPPTGPSDYRHGGPQYKNPFMKMARPPIESTEAKMCLEEFKQFWRPRYGDIWMMRRNHLKYLSRRNGEGQDFLSWASDTDYIQRQRDRLAKEEWRLQHKRDWEAHPLHHAWCEDAIYSLCAPGKVVYNLDANRMQRERENAEWELRPYCTGRHRF